MINILQNEELFQKMSHLMNRALQNSAKALSTLIEDDVRLEGLEVRLNTSKKKNFTFFNSDVIYNIASEIRGDISAESFLIFNQTDAEKLLQNIKPSPEIKNIGMLEAILLEVANILTASVVTSLSNYLDVNAFGGVPKLHKLTKDTTEKFIQTTFSDLPFSFSFKIELASLSTQIYPEFLWLVHQEFYELLEKKEI